MLKSPPLLAVLLCLSCAPDAAPPPAVDVPLGLIAIDTPTTYALFGDSLQMEVLFKDKGWLESPLVLPSGEVICSDVERNEILRWTGSGSEVYLDNSGGVADDYSREPGSNGLTLDRNGKLLLCQHGARRVVRLESDPADPDPVYTVLADRYDGKSFNSPNDLVVASDGSILFTDPPYGLPEGDRGELGYYGVYRIDTTGKVSLLTKAFTRPNGIALSPDESRLYVSQSDGQEPLVAQLAYAPGREIKSLIVKMLDRLDFATDAPGSCDGLELSPDGLLFATVPGGVAILDPTTLRVFSKITSDRPISNLTLSPQSDWLYLTNDDRLVRVKINPL